MLEDDRSSLQHGPRLTVSRTAEAIHQRKMRLGVVIASIAAWNQLGSSVAQTSQRKLICHKMLLPLAIWLKATYRLRVKEPALAADPAAPAPRGNSRGRQPPGRRTWGPPSVRGNFAPRG